MSLGHIVAVIPHQMIASSIDSAQMEQEDEEIQTN